MRTLFIKELLLTFYLFTPFRTCAADKLLFEEREKVVSLLGAPLGRVENARARVPTMDVQRFRKDGWEYVIYFDTDRADRVVISKQDGTNWTDGEITGVLLSNKSFSPWVRWKLPPNRRGWVSGGKIGPFYALIANNGHSLELITDRYLNNLARHVWLDSTDAQETNPQ